MEDKYPMDNCAAKTRNGGTCRKRAGEGTSHLGEGRCKLHGGASPQAELAGVVTLARREAATMGRPLEVNPHDAILECIRIAAGEVQYASEQIITLEHDDAVGPVTTMVERDAWGEQAVSYKQETKGPPALNIWIAVRHQAMDRLVNYSKVALAAGVAERQVKLAETQGHLLANVIRGVLRDLGVADRPEVPAVVRRHLTLVAGQAA
jgi:hypothetical protein